MIDIYRDAMLNVADAATYIAMPSSTLGAWRKDGVVHEIFIKAGGELPRARDRQQAIRETVTEFQEFIRWDGADPTQLRLRQFKGVVVLDPRFGWGRPVVQGLNVPLNAILDLWYARESMQTIADEFEMDRDAVERLIQDYDRSVQRAAA